jgi:hypothetical protein
MIQSPVFRPEQHISAVWGAARLGREPREDKIVFLPAPDPLQRVKHAPLCVNTTRFAILFVGVMELIGSWDSFIIPHYREGLIGGHSHAMFAGEKCPYSFTANVLDAGLEIKLIAPGQAHRFQVHDKGSTLVVNGSRFDLRYEKKYILVEANGKAREL